MIDVNKRYRMKLEQEEIKILVIHEKNIYYRFLDSPEPYYGWVETFLSFVEEIKTCAFKDIPKGKQFKYEGKIYTKILNSTTGCFTSFDSNFNTEGFDRETEVEPV